jgi:uncharacterized repeat protein (TIGR04138 family)
VNPERSLVDVIDGIRSNDERYRREAYIFVVAALGATVRALPADRLEDPVRRHLSGQELLRGTVELARAEFGAMAAVVFSEWGMRHGEDVGNIVFHLVGEGQLSARPEDTIEDFQGLDLIEALEMLEQAPKPQRPRGNPPSSAKRTRPDRDV